MQVSGVRAWGVGFGLRVFSQRFGVYSSGFRGRGLGCEVWGVGSQSRVWGSEEGSIARLIDFCITQLQAGK